MKKLLTTIGLMGMLFLSGCSILGEVNNTVEYANITTDYIESTKTFASEVPQLAKDAVSDETARQNLENELEQYERRNSSFNAVERFYVAEEIP